MKKLLILSLLTIILLNIGCNKKSPSNETTNNSSEIKCPNCSSTSIKSLEPSGTILECNSCGVGFEK
jgi:ribosomal protein L37AE/L43A